MTGKTGSNIIINKPAVLRVNQRAAERTKRNNRITIRVVRMQGEDVIDANLTDVSQGGFGFETAEELKVGERLRVRVKIETTQIVSQFALFVEGEAVIRRRRESSAGGCWLIGVAWDRLDRAEKEKWANFLGKARPLLL
jgi:c-di-GMP-binding flagellar brake protein YcgR